MSDLTPIRVRGKRKLNHDQHKARKVSKASKGNKASEAGNSKPRGGRPLMSLAAKQQSMQARLDKRRRRLDPTYDIHASAARKHGRKLKLSRLERLPVELLEKIFLYSLNVDFARCSPFLAAAVSSERIYRLLVLLAFWYDPSTPVSRAEQNAVDNPVSKILRFDYTPLDDEQRCSLQSSILRCRWCTVPRVVKQLPELTRLTVQRYWLDAGIRMERDEQERLNGVLVGDIQDANTFQGTGTGTGTDTTTTTTYTLTITPFISVTITSADTTNTQTTTHHILNLREIPSSLLNPPSSRPFHLSDITFLETLRVAGGFTRPERQHMLAAHKTVAVSRTALHDGIHTALVNGDARMLACLLKVDEYAARCESLCLANDNDGNDDNNPGALLPYTLPSEHFRMAVRHATSKSTAAKTAISLFRLLLRANAESLPADDPEITQFAMICCETGPDTAGADVAALGTWLLDFMLHLPRQVETARADPVHAGMFYLGRGNRQIEMARRYMADVLGLEEELGCWLEEVAEGVRDEWALLTRE